MAFNDGPGADNKKAEAKEQSKEKESGGSVDE